MIRVAYVCGRKRIYGLTNEQLDIVKGNLTFLNPQWVQIQKYSKWGNTKVNKFVHYYTLGYYPEPYIAVPMGYVLPFGETETIISDDRLSLDVDYPDFELELREIQEQATNEFECLGTLVLPTGCGKSICGLYLAGKLKQRALIVVNKDDLVDGWTQDAKLCYRDLDVGLVKGQVFKIGKHITLTTIQTLSHLGEKKLNELYDSISMLITDECLRGDTLVTLADGGVRDIKNISDGDSVLGGKVCNSFNRKARLFELQTQCSVLRGSYTHPTWCVKKKPDGKHSGYTKDDFIQKSLGELDSSYYVPILVKTPHTEKVSLSDIEARFVAMIMCDGHLDREGNRVKVNIKKDVAYYEELFAEFSNYIKVPFKKSIDIRGNTTLWFNDASVKDLLENKWGVPRGKKSDKLVIPEFLYYAPKSAIKAFIETCFNCEGDLNIGEHSERLSFNSVSEKFVMGLKHLLNKFGIIATFQSIKRKSPKHSDVSRFMILPIFNKKFVEQFKLLDRKMPKRLNGMEYKSRFIGDEYYLCSVKQVVDLGIEDIVYDFEVTGSHSFIANGVLTHNCHHAGAKSYDILNTFKAKYRLGLTATKMRNDGLVDIVDHICGKTVFDGTSFVTDVIIPPENIHIIRKNSKVFWKPEKSYYDTRTKATVHNIIFDDIEYIEGTVEWRNLMERLEAEGKVRAYSLRLHKAYELIANNETFNTSVCRDIIENYNKGKSCVVFCKTVEQLNNLYELLKERCPKIQKFYGSMKDTKAEVKRRAESKEVLITLATISIACEGTNVKAWECGFLVSSVANEKDLIQILGRLRRTTEGKTDVYFYDYRHPQVVGIKKHGYERDNWYKNLKIKS